MLTGSMCGWDVPGADPKWYEDKQQEMGGMTLGYHTIKIVLEQAWDETIEVSPAWDETVTTGYSCSCGAVK